MFTPTKIKSTIKPKKFLSLNNGIWYYNYDIVENTVTVRDIEEDKEELIYEFVLVRINGTPTFTKCYEAILKAFKNESEETLYDKLILEGNKDDLYDEIAYLVRIDFDLEEQDTPLIRQKRKLLKEIEAYDTSDAVNSFFLNGTKVWLDKGTRVGLLNSISIEKEAGRSETTLWFNGNKIIVGCTLALQMLSILELYALNCYNKTAEHRNNVQKLTTVEEVLSYDYTIGYPEKPEFNI